MQRAKSGGLLGLNQLACETVRVYVLSVVLEGVFVLVIQPEHPECDRALYVIDISFKADAVIQARNSRLAWGEDEVDHFCVDLTVALQSP